MLKKQAMLMAMLLLASALGFVLSSLTGANATYDSARATKFNSANIDDLTIDGTLTVSGLTTATGGFVLPSNAAPRTNVTPTSAGQVIWNSQDKQICVSTGTTVSTWVQAADGTTACSH